MATTSKDEIESLIRTEVPKESDSFSIDESELTQLAQKDKQTKEFFRLGVYGLLGSLLAIFAPFTAKRIHQKHHKKKTSKD